MTITEIYFKPRNLLLKINPWCIGYQTKKQRFYSALLTYYSVLHLTNETIYFRMVGMSHPC